jgi:hypothetical protein
MKAWRVVVRIVLSVGMAFLTIPVWLWVFERYNFPQWGFFHSGLPLYIAGGATYWLLGFVGVFQGGRKPA